MHKMQTKMYLTYSENIKCIFKPMVACNAPETFHLLTNQIFYRFIHDFLVMHADDLFFFSKNEEIWHYP